MNKKILFIFNQPDDFIESRVPLLKGLLKEGYQITVAMPHLNTIPIQDYPEIVFHEFHFSRRSINPFCQIKTLFDLKKILKRVNPDLVQVYRMKLILHLAILSKLIKIPALVPVFTGLGYLFTEQSLKANILKTFTKIGFQCLLNHPNMKIIFQNKDDQQEFIRQKIVKSNNTILIQGSGVNLQKFPSLPEPQNSSPVILLLSRMLWNKGIAEYVKAAEIIKNAGIKAKFLLVGGIDHSALAGIPLTQLNQWNESGIIEWREQVSSDQIPALIASANIICLPSYREGLPRVLIEGAACGRALITTDAPGCREVVKDNINGLLVPVKDPKALAEAFINLIQHPEKRLKMAEQSKILSGDFSIEKVIAENLKVYSELLEV
jgi:glycosyltransferase involved in cell wall biosynthesis